MSYLKGISASKQLIITQYKNFIDSKNQLIDETKQMISDPLIVLDDKLKKNAILTLDLCRYKPAWESIDHALKMTMQRKMLDNGWSKDSPDFNVNSRFVDNNTDEAINAIIGILNELRKLSQSGEQDHS